MMKWFEVEAPPRKRIPAWQRRAAIADDGVVYASGAVAGNETSVFYCACYDGVSVIRDGKHVYFPVEWLAREFPACASTVASIERRLESEK